MRNGNRRRGGKQDTYSRALHVLARMRRTGETLTETAREKHIDPRTVRKYLGPELKRIKAGEVQPTSADRRIRNMLIPTEKGITRASVRGSKSASLLGRYMSAVGKYLTTGDAGALEEFEGQTVGGYQLVTDLQVLSTLAQAGALQLDEIYALPGSSS